MLTIQYAKNPVYSDESGNNITMIVKFEEFNEELPFGATSYDPMPYGVQLYNNAIAGMYGPIAPYVPSEIVQPTVDGAQTL